MSFKIGDLVARQSYGADIHFRIISIDEQGQNVELKGIDTRLWADAPIDDLIHIDEEVRGRVLDKEEEQTSSSIKHLKEDREQRAYSFKLPGRVLHMDGDAQYLKKCMSLYAELDIPVYGIHVPEKDMPERVVPLLKYFHPDILVMTGHDAYLKTKGQRDEIDSYRHSSFFLDAVQQARSYERHLDHLIIFSGACQSHFEALIEAGANYASSPDRVNIHALDPVYIVEKACFTPIHRLINLNEVLQYSYTGSSGIGGIDSSGTYRTGMAGKEKQLWA